MTVVQGSTGLHLLAVRLKVAGEGGLRLELLRSLKYAANPLVPAARAAARQKLPKRGGLAERVANSAIKVQVRTGARTAGVRIVASEHDARPTNFGDVRHPVYGKNVWVAQHIPGAEGWFTDTMAQRAPAVQREIVTGMTRISREIQGGI